MGGLGPGRAKHERDPRPGTFDLRDAADEPLEDG
jgi:hypothetical protein